MDARVTLTSAGSGTLVIGGVGQQLRAESLQEARGEVIALVAAAAMRAGRRMSLHISEPDGEWLVNVAEDGTVSALDQATGNGGPSTGTHEVAEEAGDVVIPSELSVDTVMMSPLSPASVPQTPAADTTGAAPASLAPATEAGQVADRVSPGGVAVHRHMTARTGAPEQSNTQQTPGGQAPAVQPAQHVVRPAVVRSSQETAQPVTASSVASVTSPVVASGQMIPPEPVHVPSPDEGMAARNVLVPVEPAPAPGFSTFLDSDEVEQRRERGRIRRRRLIVAGVLVGMLAACGGAAGFVLAASDHHAQASKSAASTSASSAAAVDAPELIRAGGSSMVCQADVSGVTCWGAGSDSAVMVPAQIAGIEGSVVALSVGRGFGVAATSDGAVWAWGANDRGQLGTPDTPQAGSAVKVGDLPAPASLLVSGAEHTCALSNGQVFCFGSTRFGQVGGTVSDQPAGLTEVSLEGAMTGLGTSGYDMWATGADGSVWAWGSNEWGQVAPTAPGLSSTPTKVAGGE